MRMTYGWLQVSMQYDKFVDGFLLFQFTCRQVTYYLHQLASLGVLKELFFIDPDQLSRSEQGKYHYACCYHRAWLAFLFPWFAEMVCR